MYDINYLLWLQSLRVASGGVCDGFFLFISTLSFGLIASVIYTSLYWCISKDAGTFMMFSCLIGGTANQFMKNTFCVYRPWIHSAALHPVASAVPGATGYSFPSGHSAAAASQYGGLALWYREKKVLAAFLFIVMLLIGFSRNYLGVHTPQDVAVGLLIGLASAWIACRYFKRMSPFAGTMNDVLAVAVLTSVGTLLLIYTNVKTFPMDYSAGSLIVDPAKMRLDAYSCIGGLWGLLAGWLTERRLIRFTMPRNIWQGILRFIVGFLLFFALGKYIGSVIPFVHSPALRYIVHYAFLNFFIMAVYPFMFVTAEKLFRKN